MASKRGIRCVLPERKAENKGRDEGDTERKGRRRPVKKRNVRAKATHL